MGKVWWQLAVVGRLVAKKTFVIAGGLQMDLNFEGAAMTGTYENQLLY